MKKTNFIFLSILVLISACACRQYNLETKVSHNDAEEGPRLVLAGDSFFIEEAGSLYLNPEEAISGSYVLKGSYNGTKPYSEVLSANIPLKPNAEYEVSFTYKILEKADKGFEVTFYSEKAASENNWIDNLEFNGENGEKKKVSFKGKLNNYDDYKISWNIIQSGSLAIDNVTIKESSSGKIIASLDVDSSIFKIDVSHKSIKTKIENKPTIPIFNAWGTKETIGDCDTEQNPYSLIWTSIGISKEIESTETDLSSNESYRMQKDKNTIYLISPQWNCWYPDYNVLPKTSPFYLDEIFKPHENSEYPKTFVLNFEKEEWHSLLGKKALSYKNAGFEGLIFDWWSDEAGNGRSRERVQKARLNILKSIREKVGNDFILMGNVNWTINDPTSKYLSGAFMELWKPELNKGYDLYDKDNPEMSIEKMEEALLYWNQVLQWPKIIAFETWKITEGNYIEDRVSKKNIKYAKLFAAMACVIPDNGYFLYADNNGDTESSDHEHEYYDFYKTDLGKAVSGMVKIKEGIAYKIYQKGIIAYNRTETEESFKLADGTKINLKPLEGLFLKIK
ncbi:hypothetical protein E4O03_08100 [Treponema sp. OMZ 792]|uniref:putative glycoside hydrolase n=1 Tax=unclassified Treponema TaxID=2638727 RepID=UPI0020A2B688|nr:MULTISPECIES: putative glycoside hydrolase [unclassified Treponema]UTC74206.1 hypothetical protein E4O03_08100 [Treponema sp. OMZ 792]UTC80603.1 hypothetical protein E4O07_08000 [Treponema sp. OMZ 798]